MNHSLALCRYKRRPSTATLHFWYKTHGAQSPFSLAVAEVNRFASGNGGLKCIPGYTNKSIIPYCICGRGEGMSGLLLNSKSCFPRWSADNISPKVDIARDSRIEVDRMTSNHPAPNINKLIARCFFFEILRARIRRNFPATKNL